MSPGSSGNALQHRPSLEKTRFSLRFLGFAAWTAEMNSDIGTTLPASLSGFAEPNF
jgi:hypothetical protein